MLLPIQLPSAPLSQVKEPSLFVKNPSYATQEGMTPPSNYTGITKYKNEQSTITKHLKKLKSLKRQNVPQIEELNT